MNKRKIKNLFIIGNGFDCWQKLPTSYESFRQYYITHVDEIMAKLNLQPQRVKEPDSQEPLRVGLLREICCLGDQANTRPRNQQHLLLQMPPPFLT